MSRKRSVRQELFLDDLRSGMTDQQLMERYRLTPRGLGTVFRNLVNADLMSFRELIRRSTGQLNLPEMVAELRILSRKQLEFLIPITEWEKPENTGLVYDISDDGVGTRGLQVKTHEIKTLMIPADDYFKSDPIVFEGVCRWVKEHENRWESAAGFRVMRIERGSLSELQAIIKALNPYDDDLEEIPNPLK